MYHIETCWSTIFEMKLCGVTFHQCHIIVDWLYNQRYDGLTTVDKVKENMHPIGGIKHQLCHMSSTIISKQLGINNHIQEVIQRTVEARARRDL